MFECQMSDDPDLSTDAGAERFLVIDHDVRYHNALRGLYRCARGPIAQGGRGLSIIDALEHVLMTYLKIQKDAATVSP